MRAERELCASVFVAAALLYLAFPSSFYNFDGIACAIAVELPDLKNLAHGNHVAYGLLGLAFDRAWRLLGFRGAAIVPLSALNGLLGAATAAAFCSTLLRLRLPRGAAAACAAGLAVSQAFWFWSLEAQVYPLGMFFLMLAAREALADRPRPALVGAWQGCAMLGHVGHAMFAPAALYLVARERKNPKAALTRYATALGCVVAAAYAAAALFFIRPRSLDELRLWLLGSAALKVDRSFTWYGGYSLANVYEWLRMSARVFCEPAGRAAGWLLSGSALAAAVWGAWRPEGGRRDAARAAALWVAGYAVLFVAWQPYTVVYRVSDLPAFWLLISLAAARWPRGAAAAAAWVAGAFAFNLATLVLPRADPANNAPLQEVLWVARATPEDSWVVATGMGQVYLPYFAHRRPLNMRYYEARLEALPARLDELGRAREPVFVTSTTLGGQAWDGTLRAYGLVEVGREGGVSLYRVKRTGSPRARAGRS